MMEDRDGFSFTYSAEEQAELKRLRDKYSEDGDEAEDKMDRLRRLDRRVSERAASVSLIFGIVGALILGFGMSLAMSELGTVLGMEGGVGILVGSLIGVVGGIVAGLAYPVYSFVLKRERARVAPEILRLTDELLK